MKVCGYLSVRIVMLGGVYLNHQPMVDTMDPILVSYHIRHSIINSMHKPALAQGTFFYPTCCHLYVTGGGGLDIPGGHLVVKLCIRALCSKYINHYGHIGDHLIVRYLTLDCTRASLTSRRGILIQHLCAFPKWRPNCQTYCNCSAQLPNWLTSGLE